MEHTMYLPTLLNIECALQSISPGMVDTELLGAYDLTLYASLPKLNVKDVTSAVLYALGTPDYVQV